MPASDPPAAERAPRLGPMVALGARLVACAAALWLVAWAMAAPSFTWHLYRAPFDDTLGHRLAGKLAASRARGGASVVILGASTAREGFDERLLSSLCPGAAFFNTGLAGGSVDTLAVATLMLERSGARPALALVALHPWMLRAMDQDVVARGYSDFFDAWGAEELLAYQFQGEGLRAARDALRRQTLFPPLRHARQLGRLLRAGLQQAHQRLYWGPRLPPASFQVAHDDTTPMAEYRFTGRAGEGFPAMLRRWERQGYLDAKAYADPALAERLGEVLRRVEARAGRVAVVVMPEHTYLRERVAPLCAAPFEAQLAAARARGTAVLEHAALLPDEAFLDLAHVGPEGRAALSRAVAPEARALLDAGAQAP